MQALPGGVQMPQLALQHTVPAAQVVAPHFSPLAGTQAHTEGDGFQTVPLLQSAMTRQAQMPPQSAPPRRGWQLSLGSSSQLPPPAQRIPAMPPQRGPSGTQVGAPGQGARTQTTGVTSQ
jgi:hypothetical protein